MHKAQHQTHSPGFRDRGGADTSMTIDAENWIVGRARWNRRSRLNLGYKKSMQYAGQTKTEFLQSAQNYFQIQNLI